MSLFNPPLHIANAIYNAAYVALIIGALITVSGTVALFWSEGIRSRFADERISKNEAEVAQAQAEAAKAKAEAAEAGARAAEANLELEKLRAPRTLGTEQQKRLIAKLDPFLGQKFSFLVVADTEPINLMYMIETSLKAAGWERTPSQIGDIEIAGAGITYGTAVEIQMPPIGDSGIWERAKLLAAALTSEGIVASAKLNPALKEVQVINVMVGKKP
jgi:hypothetical protein